MTNRSIVVLDACKRKANGRVSLGTRKSLQHVGCLTLHLVATLTLLVSVSVGAAPSEAFLDRMCRLGFNKTTMPAAEVTRFCACVVEDVAPRLTPNQRAMLLSSEASLEAGKSPSEQAFVTSGVRDLVIAGQARCEASFYPPSAPLLLKAPPMELTLRCDDERRDAEAFIYLRDIHLLSKEEISTVDKRMMKDDFKPEYAQVTISFDGRTPIVQRWGIDLTGQIVAPPNPAKFLEQLRVARSLSVKVERGTTRIARDMAVAGKIPSRWVPCVR